MTQHKDDNQPSLATHLIMIGEDAAPVLLCERHAHALKNMLTMATVDYASYEIHGHRDVPTDSALDPSESLCQACDLSEVTRPEIILPH